MKFQINKILGCALMVVALSACQHQQRQSSTSDNLTVGTVQAQLKKGMSSSEVIGVLGSPNVVSTDKEGREVWVYDKFSTESSNSGVSTGLIPGLFINGNSSSSSKSQSTLTVIVKFDDKNMVRDIAYHRTKF